MSDNGIIGRDGLLGLTERRYKVVEIGEKRIRIQSLTELEKARLENKTIMRRSQRLDKDEMDLVRQRLIAACVVDQKGERLFGVGDMEALGRVDGWYIAHLYRECREHVGLDEGELEELVKNSAETSAVSSPDSSQEPSSTP